MHSTVSVKQYSGRTRAHKHTHRDTVCSTWAPRLSGINRPTDGPVSHQLGDSQSAGCCLAVTPSCPFQRALLPRRTHAHSWHQRHISHTGPRRGASPPHRRLSRGRNMQDPCLFVLRVFFFLPGCLNAASYSGCKKNPERKGRKNSNVINTWNTEHWIRTSLGYSSVGYFILGESCPSRICLTNMRPVPAARLHSSA